jgi:hypothetical protein
MNNACDMKFDMKAGDSFTIRILPETGYAFILNQNAS